MDRIYDRVDFRSDLFRKYLSKTGGDGGLEPGKLTFEEELERFSGDSFAADILPKLTEGRKADKENIGGPCIVALINAAQLAYEESVVSFYGCCGDDEVGKDLLQKLRQTPIDLSRYRVQQGAETASTSVLSDPNYDNGHGERTFVNTIGASWHYLPAELDDSFFDADICVFGGTALVPKIHQGLTALLERAKQSGSITIVNTVYDFLNEKKDPAQRWPMGDSDEAYRFIDLLIVDHEEALRLSGCADIPSSISFFREKGAGAVLVTNGAHDVWLWADSPLFGKVPEQTLPVSAAVGKALKEGRKGDSTGCGDNFAGGVIGSLARQIKASKLSNLNSKLTLDLVESTKWGIVSGGFACFYYGGTYIEKKKGEKLTLLQELYDQY
jgi:sugar/nucleoside kinase (ribokinase family)